MFDKKEQARILRIEWRKRLLIKRGLKFSDIGHKGDVSRVIREIRRYPKLRRKIARAARVSYKKFWAGAR